MDRKKFLKKGIFAVGAISTMATTYLKQDITDNNPKECKPSPTETDGPFIIKSPVDLVRENIIGDRTGIPLLIKVKVENTNNNCEALEGVLVDIWHCDTKGNYSEYSRQIDGDFTNKHFLRGRQTTDHNGEVSFVSIYPGWYPGRAPHLHLEILNTDGESLLITQTAFPEDISEKVYRTKGYKGASKKSNADDAGFKNSLHSNLATSVIGNLTDGYILTETIKVAG